LPKLLIQLVALHLNAQPARKPPAISFPKMCPVPMVGGGHEDDMMMDAGMSVLPAMGLDGAAASSHMMYVVIACARIF
jgi:hypothetical protein